MSLKDAYIEKLQLQLQKAEAEIARLDRELQAKQADAKISQSIENKLALLRDKRDQLNKKMHELNNSASASFEELKQGIENAYDELAATIKKAADKF